MFFSSESDSPPLPSCTMVLKALPNREMIASLVRNLADHFISPPNLERYHVDTTTKMEKIKTKGGKWKNHFPLRDVANNDTMATKVDDPATYSRHVNIKQC